MLTTKYLMLKVAYHRPISSPWVVRGAWAQMNSNCHRHQQRRETIEELRDDEPQVGVVNWVVVLLTVPFM